MLVKDAPILDLLRNRVIVSYGSVDSAKTIETRRLWEHRKKCYQKAMECIRMAEKIPGTELIMDFSDGDVCVKG